MLVFYQCSGIFLISWDCFFWLQAPDTTSIEAWTREHKPFLTACYETYQRDNKSWNERTRVIFLYTSCTQYFLSLFLSSFINLSYTPSACHLPSPPFQPFSTSSPSMSSLPPLASPFLPHLSYFSSLSCSIHLSPSSFPWSSHRFVNTVRWPALTRYTHAHTAVPTSPQWPLHARLCG